MHSPVAMGGSSKARLSRLDGHILVSKLQASDSVSSSGNGNNHSMGLTGLLRRSNKIMFEKFLTTVPSSWGSNVYYHDVI